MLFWWGVVLWIVNYILGLWSPQKMTTSIGTPCNAHNNPLLPAYVILINPTNACAYCFYGLLYFVDVHSATISVILEAQVVNQPNRSHQPRQTALTSSCARHSSCALRLSACNSSPWRAQRWTRCPFRTQCESEF